MAKCHQMSNDLATFWNFSQLLAFNGATFGNFCHLLEIFHIYWQFLTSFGKFYHLLASIREHLLKKKNVFFRALPKFPPPPPLLLGNLYIFFGRQKGIYKVYFSIQARASPPPHSGNARKKTFFFPGGVPLTKHLFN